MCSAVNAQEIHNEFLGLQNERLIACVYLCTLHSKKHPEVSCEFPSGDIMWEVELSVLNEPMVRMEAWASYLAIRMKGKKYTTAPFHSWCFHTLVRFGIRVAQRTKLNMVVHLRVYASASNGGAGIYFSVFSWERKFVHRGQKPLLENETSCM